jgi:hypothetical protein
MSRSNDYPAIYLGQPRTTQPQQPPNKQTKQEKPLMKTTTTQTTRAGLDELTKIVAAVALHASTDQQRYALTGIYITGQHIQATDSYTLGRYTPAEPITTGEPALINARELTTALNNLNKAAGKATTTATLTITGQTWQLTATSGETTIGSYNGHTMPAEFPNSQQLFDLAKPATTPHEPTGLNPEYLERITKASRKLAPKTTPLTMAIWQTPEKPIIFTTTTETGQLNQILMPQRINQ